MARLLAPNTDQPQRCPVHWCGNARELAWVIWMVGLSLVSVSAATGFQDPGSQTNEDQKSQQRTETDTSPKVEANTDFEEIEASNSASVSPADHHEEESNSVAKEKPRYQHKKYNNVVYAKGDDYRLLCDIYKPEGAGPFPAVVAIHGGAWRHGSKFQMLRHAWKLASAGYVVVAINYRLSPEYQFPAQVHDCKQAVRWVRHKSEKLNVDPEKIAVFGYSAGGHLGAMLATSDSEDGLEGEVLEGFQQYSSRVQCVVVGGAPCEFGWIKSRALVDWLGKTPSEAPELYLKAAPITYVSADDPPVIFFHGSKDSVVPPRSSRILYEQLKQQNVDCRYHTIEGKGHFSTFSDTTWLDEAIEFMDKKLGRTHDG